MLPANVGPIIAGFLIRHPSYGRLQWPPIRLQGILSRCLTDMTIRHRLWIHFRLGRSLANEAPANP